MAKKYQIHELVGSLALTVCRHILRKESRSMSAYRCQGTRLGGNLQRVSCPSLRMQFNIKACWAWHGIRRKRGVAPCVGTSYIKEVSRLGDRTSTLVKVNASDLCDTVKIDGKIAVPAVKGIAQPRLGHGRRFIWNGPAPCVLDQVHILRILCVHFPQWTYCCAISV